MAADLEQKSPGATIPKYATYVEEQLARVKGRVRWLDIGRAGLFFLIATMVYALGMALADRAWDLPIGIRLVAFLIYVGTAGFFLFRTGVYLARKVNPYYAALLLEKTLPDPKNSVVNWLDLRNENLPPVILNSLGTRAARDLKRADPDHAIHSRGTWILGSLAGVFGLALVVLFILGPQQFQSLMGRAFAPFLERSIASRNTITILQPAEGNAVVSPQKPILFKARIDGPVPALNHEGSPRLHVRFNPEDAFADLPLEQDVDGNWYYSMSPDQVLNGGLWYKITAGDAETEVFQVQVIPIPQVGLFEARYHWRPYLHHPDQTDKQPAANFRGLKALRGTKVALSIHTNCQVNQGWLELTWGKERTENLTGEISATDPSVLCFPKFVLDRNGSFRVLFISREGEKNIDRSPYTIEVIADLKPEVEIKVPGMDVHLPSNGTLMLEGEVRDDFGIRNMTLRLRLAKGGKEPLAPLPYRPGKSFQLANGKYPPRLEYKDFLPLDQVKTGQGKPFPLTKDMVLEYWLEAADNCDFPDKDGQIGKSKIYKVIIQEPESDPKKQQGERQDAQKQKQQHDQKQDQDWDQKNEAAKQEGKSGNNLSKEEKNQKDNLEKDLNKIADKFNNQEKKSQESKNPDGSKNENPQPSNPSTKGEGKGSDQSNSEAKGSGDNPQQKPEAKDSKEGKNENRGNSKDAGKEPTKAGGARDQGSNQLKKEQEKAKGEGKDEGKKSPEAGPQGSKKDGGPREKKGTSSKSGPKEDQAKGKDKGPGDEPGKISKTKGDGTDDPNQKPMAGNTKGGDIVPKAINKPGEPKTGSENQPLAKKGGYPKKDNQHGPSQSKSADPDQAKQVSRFKDDNSSESTPEQNPKARKPDLNEIGKWLKKMTEGDGKTREQAEKELERIGKEAKKKEIREAAEKALKQAREAKGKGNGGKGSTTDSGETQAKTEKKLDTKDNNPGGGTPKGQLTKNADPRNKGKGGFGSGAKGFADDPKASEPDKEAARRAGELFLRQMKDVLNNTSAEIRKKKGISEDQWKKFQQDVARYEKLVKRLQANQDPGVLKGGAGKLTSIGPKQVVGPVTANPEALQSNQPRPPPEFEEAQRIFNNIIVPGKK